MDMGRRCAGTILYNGTLDDAAYVALLIQMAEDLKAGAVGHAGLSAVSYVRGGVAASFGRG